MSERSKLLASASLLALPILLVSCSPSEDQIKGTLLKNPDIVFEVIEKNPDKFMKTMQIVTTEYRKKAAEDQQSKDREELTKSFENPLKPNIDKSDAIRGPRNAPLVLVEYSDFQCPFCSRGNQVVNQLISKYGDQIQLVYKHLPLSFHDKAMIAAQYFEAIKIQNEEKAFKFHDEIFKAQNKLSNGEKFLKEIAKNLGIDMKKLESDLHSDKVLEQIKEHEAEAAKFGMQGTPGFILNGIPVRGAYPIEHFENIISELKKRGLVTLK